MSGKNASSRRAPERVEKLQGTGTSYPKRTIALVYDFDGTLSPKPMQEYGFLPKIGVEPKAFWAEVERKAAEDVAEGLIVYMHLMYKKAKTAGVEIRRNDLVALGADVELYAGVDGWFDDIDKYVALRAETPVEVRHYLISSGLREIIEGTRIFRRFHNVFASEYYFEPYELPFPKRVITDTSKTQYLFRINKGVEDLRQTINSHMPEGERPIPFSNMIYFGDGDTDVPSMAVMRQNGGYAVAVHGPGESAVKCEGLYRAGRIDFYAPADYRNGSTLFRRTCLLLDRALADIRVREERWSIEQELAKTGAAANARA
ncbi:MAG: haloacid dehalogenase-like hydrolase [Rhizobiales bacterium]|nr:haloacid dehalogenase-like hydrolase [Hyphomicrobiales bacterium]